MSEMKVVFDKKNKNKDGSPKKKIFIEDVVFYYVMCKTPRLKAKSDKQKEYSVTALVSEEVADQFSEMFPKNKVIKIKTSEFEERFKTTPPDAKAKYQYLIKAKMDATFRKTVEVKWQDKDGNQVKQERKEGDYLPAYTRPKVYVPAEGGVVDVTQDVLIGNGSKGTLQLSVRVVQDEEFPQLTAILVTDLVEYIPSGTVESDFGTVVNTKRGGNSDQFRDHSEPDNSHDDDQDFDDITDDDDIPF